MKFKKMTLNINGADRTFICDPEKDTLAEVVRRLGLTGTKVGCGTGLCGSCTVLLNDELVRSCTRKISRVEEYSELLTIEGIGSPRYLHPLQVAFMHYGAVQCGFCSPGFIVSSYALLQKNPNPAREEVRDWFQKHRNICRCTGFKQIVDAVMQAAKVMRGECTIDDIKVDQGTSGDYYGKPMVRPAALAKVCGVADYGDDIELKMPDSTLHVVMVQPKKTHHAKILSINTGDAEKMPGVYKVVTAKDVKGSNRLTFAPLSYRTKATGQTHILLAEDKIYNYGDIIALVAADTKAHAQAAAEKVTMEYEALPAYLTFLEAVMPDADRIHDQHPNIWCDQPTVKDADNIEEIFEEAPYVVEGSFSSSREPHMPIEGDTVQAYWGDDDMLTVQCKSQGIYMNRADIAEATGLPEEKVRVIQNPAGATFGWGISAATYSLAAIACLACDDMPVAFSMSYEQYMAYSGKRCPSYSNSRLACDENGKLIAADWDVGLDHGPYNEMGDDCIKATARFVYFPYSIPHVAGLTRVACSNHSYGTAYRGFGSPQAYTCSEAMMDMLAEKAGIDPFEFRWRNIGREGDTNVNSVPFIEYPMEEIMNTMRPYYEKAVKCAKAEDTPEKRRGVGIAWGGYIATDGPEDESQAAIELAPGNKFIKYDTWQDVGQGGDVGSLQCTLKALEELDVKPEDILLRQNDSIYGVDSGVSAASRSHNHNVRATKDAADKLIAAMKKPDGTFRTYDEMIAEGIPVRYEGLSSNKEFDDLYDIDPNTGIGNPSPFYTYGLFLAEVEVDTATGKTTVVGYRGVVDVGTIGNITSVEGQAFGGFSHCIGFALKEQYTDVVKHRNMVGAGIPEINDIPDNLQVINVGTPKMRNPYGSSGASEAFQSGGHMAVINAINNACGVRVYELPATPEKVKAGIDAFAKGEPDPNKPEKYFMGSDLYEELENIKNNPITV